MTKKLEQVYGKVWVSSPDPIDGYFVEIIEFKHGKTWQLDCEWRPTVELCREWVSGKGIGLVEV